MPFPTPDAARRPSMQPGTVVWLLVLLLGIQPVTTDLYLPALPTLQLALGAGLPAAQLTLSALIITFGLAQLIAGPLSDRHGRRPVLLSGLALYTAASVGSAFAGTIEALIGWRMLQGAAMAAAVTGARSIVRDLFEPQDGARVMARAFSGLGLIAMASPLLGGLLAQGLDWHAALMAPALFGAVTLGLVAWRYKETVPRRDPQATHLAPLLRNWVEVGSHPGFRAWTAMLALAYGGLFVILAGSSFVYIGMLGLSKLAYGVMMAGNSIAYIGGTFLCRRWLSRIGLRHTVRRASWLSLAGGLGMAGDAVAGWESAWALFLPQCLFAVGHGIHQPCGQAGAVGPFPEKAGTAASLSGFAMMLMAFAVGSWLGQQLGATAHAYAFGLAAFGTALFIVAHTLVQRDGDPAPRGAAAGLPATP